MAEWGAVFDMEAAFRALFLFFLRVSATALELSEGSALPYLVGSRCCNLAMIICNWTFSSYCFRPIYVLDENSPPFNSDFMSDLGAALTLKFFLLVAGEALTNGVAL